MKLDTDIYWVRHAPTWAKELNGWTDIAADLSDHEVFDWLNRTLPTAAYVISSDLQRASKTADILSSNRKRLADIIDLREINFGDWEGKTAKQIMEFDPVNAMAFWSDPSSASPPKGESWIDFTNRINTYIDRMIKNYPSTSIIIVAHFGVILSYLQSTLKIPPEVVIRYNVTNLSISRFKFQYGCWHLCCFNKLPYYKYEA